MTTDDPSAENAAEDTTSEWPANVFMHSPVVALQILAVLSWEAVTTEEPSVENAAEHNKTLPQRLNMLNVLSSSRWAVLTTPVIIQAQLTADSATLVNGTKKVAPRGFAPFPKTAAAAAAAAAAASAWCGADGAAAAGGAGQRRCSGTTTRRGESASWSL